MIDRYFDRYFDRDPFDNWSIARLQRFQLMTSAEDNVADIGVAFELIKLIALRFFFFFNETLLNKNYSTCFLLYVCLIFFPHKLYKNLFYFCRGFFIQIYRFKFNEASRFFYRCKFKN